MHDDIRDMANGDGVSVHTGFPNPALEHRGVTQPLTLDLNQLLIKHPSSTYLFRVAGHSWSEYDIFDGDIAVVDRALQPVNTDLIIVWRDTHLTLIKRRFMQPQDQLWGTIKAIIRQLKK